MTDINNGELELRRRQNKTQMVTIQTKQNAVYVQRAYKRYGTKKNPTVILDGLNMTVPKGAIYGLLGASGCGKTTLLSCIVGRKRLNSGEIWVLGGKPGSRGSGVPGPRIGYMPQEIALYGEFSIRETLTYFGWIAGMKNEDIQRRLDFLIKFLMLPNADRSVKSLSGGQQRRVSLASALLHEPELLILDEPTVGVDPLLRQNIWDHLVDISKSGNTTIIITTHYIDETRQAHLIGLMRGGYFLAEESPSKLLTQFDTNTLENVFLKLSVIQNLGRRRRSSIAQDVISSITVPSGVVNQAMIVDEVTIGDSGHISGEFGDNISTSYPGARRVSIVPLGDSPNEASFMPILPFEEPPPPKLSDYLKIVNYKHMQALVWKNFLWMMRNRTVMLFITLIPVAQIVLFCASIGHDPYHLNIAVVNHELNEGKQCEKTLTCNSTELGCHFLGYLEKKTMHLVYYDSEMEAKDSVLRGNTYASVIVKQNYSAAIQNRLQDWNNAFPWDVRASEIEIMRDVSSKMVSEYIKLHMYESFQAFIQDYLETCDINRNVVKLPIRFEKPIYGLHHPNFTDFALPGVILTVIFFLAVALTSVAMLIERNEGILERSLVIGISGIEILAAHVISQFSVMVIQSIMVLIFSFAIFNMSLNGSLVLVTILTLMTGFCGMCYGFVVSCVSSNEKMATYAAVGSFLPTVMLCGILWPTEAMHYILQSVSFLLPLTLATESMRSVLQRGWNFSEPVVYIGYISISIWIVILLTICILILKFKKG